MLGTSNLSLFIKTSNIWKCENRRWHSKNRVLCVYDKTLNTHIYAPNMFTKCEKNPSKTVEEDDCTL